MDKKVGKVTNYKYKTSQANLKRFAEWLRYLYIINNKPDNQQIIFDYFFNRFALSPELFYLFVEYFKEYLLELDDQEEKRQLAFKYLKILSPMCEKFNFLVEKEFLDDVCFKIDCPKEFSGIEKWYLEQKYQLEAVIEKAILSLKKALSAENYDHEVKTTNKTLYSLYQMSKLGLNKNMAITDLFELRIILKTNSSKECFKVLALLHNKFKPITASLEDSIRIPKINGHQDLQTELENLVKGLDLSIKIHIRTSQMDNFNENGLSKHWLSNKVGKKLILNKKEQRLVHYLFCLGNQYKLDKKIICFSESGEILKLPGKFSVIDLAYFIHKNLGSKTKGALVNNTEKPIYYRLKEGDQVRIILAKEDQVDKKWLSYSHTLYAKKKISEYLKKTMS